MRRRDVLKGAALVAAGSFVSFRALAKKGEAKTVQTLMSETYNGETRRMRVELHVYRDEDGKFRDRFQELVEDWEARTGSPTPLRPFEGFHPVGKVTWEPVMEDGEPWLIHPSWDPPSEDNPAVLVSNVHYVFRERRWVLIQRAVDLRQHAYWRQEYLPKAPRGLDGGGMSPGMAYYRMYCRVARSRLHKVIVRFEAIPKAELRRYLGATEPEYAWLQDEVEALDKLYRNEKLTTRTYLRCRQERWDRMDELETAALG